MRHVLSYLGMDEERRAARRGDALRLVRLLAEVHDERRVPSVTVVRVTSCLRHGRVGEGRRAHLPRLVARGRRDAVASEPWACSLYVVRKIIARRGRGRGRAARSRSLLAAVESSRRKRETERERQRERVAPDGRQLRREREGRDRRTRSGGGRSACRGSWRGRAGTGRARGRSPCVCEGNMSSVV